jgi:NitT/TauT family transport system ATP-binding protein
MLEIRDVSFAYQSQGRTVPALEGIDLSVAAGESLAVIGPSGCGKSTLLYLISGLFQPSNGVIRLSGGSPREHQRDAALILQGYGLFPWKTVWQNVALGLVIRRLPAAEINERVTSILSELGILEVKDRYPDELSGGQKQRVAIGRSLAIQPRLLLMDEPFSALDALTREKLQNLMLELANKHSMTTILVTHSIEEAVFLGRRILVISHRPGRIVEIVDNPAMGREDYRTSSEFLERANHVRSLFREIGARGEGGDADAC